MKSNKLVIILIIFVLLSQCSKKEIIGDWHLVGEPVLFQFNDKELKVLEHDDMILKAKKISSENEQIQYKIYEVGKSLILEKKYQTNEIIHFNQPLFTNKSELNYLLKTSSSEQRYVFQKNKKLKIIKSLSLLNPVETKEFLLDPAFKISSNIYKIKAFSSNSNDQSINNLIDQKLNSGWENNGLNYLFKDYFEFFFYSEKNEELKNDITIKGIGFFNSQSENNQNKFKERFLFHRFKKVMIQFTKDYQGGFGKTKGQYNNSVYEIEFLDKPGLQVIYFYKTIYCKGIKINVKEIYPGLQNKMSCNEIIFYTMD